MKYGEEDLFAWEKYGSWPINSYWSQSEDLILEQIRNFLLDLNKLYAKESTIFLVSSQGRLRHFLKLLPNAYRKLVDSNGLSIKTGHVAKLDLDAEQAELIYWNKNAQEIIGLESLAH